MLFLKCGTHVKDGHCIEPLRKTVPTQKTVTFIDFAKERKKEVMLKIKIGLPRSVDDWGLKT